MEMPMFFNANKFCFQRKHKQVDKQKFVFLKASTATRENTKSSRPRFYKNIVLFINLSEFQNMSFGAVCQILLQFMNSL